MPLGTLQQIRKRKFDAMIASDLSKMDPSLLPPSPRAAFFHELRVYQQIQVWKCLRDTDNDPCKWGWKKENDKFMPILTDLHSCLTTRFVEDYLLWMYYELQ